MSTEGIISILATGDHQPTMYGPHGILEKRRARGGADSEFIARYHLFLEAIDTIVSECPEMACWIKFKTERDVMTNLIEQFIGNNDPIEDIKKGIQDEMPSSVSQEATDKLILFLFPFSTETVQSAPAHNHRQNSIFSRTAQKLRGVMGARQI